MDRVPIEESMKVQKPEDDKKMLVMDGKGNGSNVFIMQRQH